MRIFRAAARTVAFRPTRVRTATPRRVRRFGNCPKLSESRAEKRRTSLGPQRRVGRSWTVFDLLTTCTDALLRPRGNGSHSTIHIRRERPLLLASQDLDERVPSERVSGRRVKQE